MPLDEVRVPAMDRAFLFGDAVYEVVRIYSGRIWHLDEHLQRLAASCKQMHIDFDVSVVPPRMKKIIKDSGLQEALGYVQVTRGVASRQHHYPTQIEANCLVYAEPFDDPYKTLRMTGGKAIMYPDIRWARNDIKSTSLAANCMAASAARQRGCVEAILLKNDVITEGSHTSVFGVMDGKVIVSPSSEAVLPGITKKQVIELCQATAIEMQEGRLHKDDLPVLQELFITATPEEIIGIVEVDDIPIGSGQPGPITQQLQAEFERTVQAWLAKAVR